MTIETMMFTKTTLHDGRTLVIVQDHDGNAWHELDGQEITGEEASLFGQQYWAEEDPPA